MPNWWIGRNLRDAIGVLEDEGYDIIDHIRATGQIGSGASDTLADREFREFDWPVPEDKNARERALAAAEFAAGIAEEKRTSLARKARLKKLAEDRDAWNCEQAKQQLEYEEAVERRKAERIKQDKEWEAARPVSRHYIPFWKRGEIIEAHRVERTRYAKVRDYLDERKARKRQADQQTFWESVRAEEQRRAARAEELAERDAMGKLSALASAIRRFGQAARDSGRDSVLVHEIMAAVSCYDIKAFQVALAELGINWEPP
jgi:hypothetical protein